MGWADELQRERKRKKNEEEQAKKGMNHPSGVGKRDEVEKGQRKRGTGKGWSEP